ncbi:MAG: hypothetical protein IPK20_18205 [Betaproteobacteria bacterium]|nr:hypothetical protein [Betaproteobacteria bacterium]
MTWFVDEATQGERRIVRLRMGNFADARGHPADPLVAIVARLGAALNSDNPTGLVEITRFPFAFGAHTLERDEAPMLWAALRMPALQSCLARGVPVRAGEGVGRLDCEGTVFEFRTAADGRWLFAGIPKTR